MIRVGRDWRIAVAGALAVGAMWTSGPALAVELRAAAVRGDVAAVKRFIADRSRNIDATDGIGQTALLSAVATGKTEVAKLLIDAGANIDAVAENKDTPWLLAGARGRTEILKYMWSKGPNLKLTNRYGGTALIPACHYGHLETVRFLLTTKIDIDHVNNLGWTCLLEIVLLTNGTARDAEIARLVLEAGANPNIADKDGVTALAHARKRGLTLLVDVITAKGGR